MFRYPGKIPITMTSYDLSFMKEMVVISSLSTLVEYLRFLMFTFLVTFILNNLFRVDFTF